MLTFSSQKNNQTIEFPVFWRRLMMSVAIGKAGVGGAGAALAVLGALNIAQAVSAQHWVNGFEDHYLHWFAAGGGALGVFVGWFLKRLG
jgi:hypothetical protein